MNTIDYWTVVGFIFAVSWLGLAVFILGHFIITFW